MVNETIRLGISSCLLGERVRYDGDHKRDKYITRILSRYMEFVPVCPEVGIGMGVPRPPIHLVVRGRRSVRAIGRSDASIDVTLALSKYALEQAHRLGNISGYIFKSRSPSCGVFSVPIHDKGQIRLGRGIYAGTFLERCSLLPVEEEGRLADPILRDNFLERVFAYHRWQMLAKQGITPSHLMQFHAAHKYALMAHRPRAVSELGRIAASVAHGRATKIQDYLFLFMDTLAQPASSGRHANALQHIAGYLREKISAQEQKRLMFMIANYRAGVVSRRQVLVLLRRHFRRHLDPYIRSQTYLFPEPTERKLRSL